MLDMLPSLKREMLGRTEERILHLIFCFGLKKKNALFVIKNVSYDVV